MRIEFDKLLVTQTASSRRVDVKQAPALITHMVPSVGSVSLTDTCLK